MFFGFHQSRTGVLKIQAVHFFLGQTFQEAQVVDGNDGRQILAAAGDDDPLLTVSRSIYEVGKLLSRFRNTNMCHDVPLVRIVPFPWPRS